MGSAAQAQGAGATTSPTAATAARWPGHQPGRVYLGVSSPTPVDELEKQLGNIGVHRTFYRWEQASFEDKRITAAHQDGRLPWVSFKPPTTEPGGWAAVARGKHDADIRARARRYAAHGKPIVSTFHHEPTNDNTGSGSDYADAWVHIHDVMKDETGLENVTFAPIIGDWAFNPRNKEVRPGAFVTGELLDRAPFLGMDIYQNSSGNSLGERVERARSYLAQWGHSDMMVGVGETGCTDHFGNVSAVDWWRQAWDYVSSNPDKVGVVSYFNSSRNSKQEVYWPLDESRAKTEAFRQSLSSKQAAGSL